MLTERISCVIKNYNEIINAKNGTVGSIFKHYRKKNNMTLEELSTGICSLSYLCKVEKNQMIPSAKVLKEVSSRLQIKEIVREEKKNTDWVLPIIKNKKVNPELFSNQVNKIDYQSKLINYAYYIFNLQDFKNGYHTYLDLLEYYEYFSTEELLLYVYVVYTHFYLESKFDEVVKLFLEFSYFELEDDFKIEINKILIHSLFKTGRNVEAINQVQKVIKDYFLKLSNEDIAMFREYELISKSRILKKQDLIVSLEMIESNKDINKDLVWFNYYFYNEENYLKSLNHITKIKDHTDEYFITYLFNLSRLNNEEKIKSEVLSYDQELKNELYKSVIFYFKNKYETLNPSKLIKELFLIFKTSSDSYLKQFIYSDLREFCLKNSLYKLAYEILEEENLFLRKKELVIY